VGGCGGLGGGFLINVPIISTHTWLLALLAPGGTDTHSVSPLHVLPARATYTPSPARATLGNVDRTQGSSLSRLWGLGATSPTTCQQVFRCCCIARSVNNIRDLWVGNSSVSNPDFAPCLPCLYITIAAIGRSIVPPQSNPATGATRYGVAGASPPNPECWPARSHAKESERVVLPYSIFD